MIENRIKPEYECFEIGHLDYHPEHGQERPGARRPHAVQLRAGGVRLHPATVGNLNYLVKQIPSGSTWTVTGIGRSAWDMAAAGIVMGGNVRVGFEDNIYLGKGHKAASNGELVAKVVRLSKELGREIANPGEARRILSLA